MYLGLDLGTSGVKALLIDANQQVVGSASSPLNVSRPQPGWSEQDPVEWVRAAQAAMAGVKAAHPEAFKALRGIGLSGQMHGATLLDADDKVLRPCILWNDVRSHRQAAALDADSRFRVITGNIVFPGFTAPKLVWVAEHEPEIFARIHRVLLPKDYLRLWLTGESFSDMSDAAGTAWLDTGGRKWSPELLAATGMDERQMPALVEGVEPAGVLRSGLAAEWGLGAGIVVAGGAGDNAAAACGMGVIDEGAAFVSLGTSGVLFAANDSYRPQPASAVHTFCHALPGTWHQMGVILCATDALNWHSGLTGLSAAELIAEQGDSLKAPSSVTFLPYLSGERTPHNDASARGAFVGLGRESDRAALTQAVLEGVAFAIRDNLVALRSAGAQITRVMATGGGAQSSYWLSALATALEIPVDRPADGDFGAAFGAARLGLIAATGAMPKKICTAPAIAETFEPITPLAQAYADAYARYRALYPALRSPTP